MKTTTRITLLAGALVLSNLVAAQEQVSRDPYALLGINVMKSDSDWNADGKRVGGTLKAGIPLTQSIDVQVGGGQASNKENGLTYRQTTLGVDGLWLFSRSTLRPFLLGGIGAEHDNLNGRIDNSATSPYANAGAGLQWQFAKSAFLQTDARYIHGFLDKDWNQNHSQNWLLNVGVAYVFGKAPQAAPASSRATPIPVAEPTAVPVAPVVKPTATPVPTATAVPSATPVPTATPKPAPKFEKVTLSASSLFAVGQAKLGADKRELNQLASALKSNPDVKQIQVNGYTDRLGSDKANQALSQKRADAVKSYLVSQGVVADRIKAVGKGSADPVAKCDNVKQRAELVSCLAPNRRIEIEPITVQQAVK